MKVAILNFTLLQLTDCTSPRSLGAVIVVMAFCLLIVGIDAWRVSLYDEETLDKLMMHLHHCNNTLLMHLPEAETIYQMAQRKCEDLRERFRSRSGTPVKAPEIVEAVKTPDREKLKLMKEEDEVLVVVRTEVEDEEKIEVVKEGEHLSVDFLSGFENEKEGTEIVNSEELSGEVMGPDDSGLRNRGPKS